MTPDFKVWVEELFEPFGRVTVKRFFGGGGIYLGETMFALIGGGDTIHLKTDESTRPDFLAEGSEEFCWTNPRTGGALEARAMRSGAGHAIRVRYSSSRVLLISMLTEPAMM